MKNNTITLEEVEAWAEKNDFTCVDDRTHGSIWIGSDGEELLDDAIEEIIEAEKAKPLDNFFGDVSGALNKLSIIK
jgi:hypothetical protein